MLAVVRTGTLRPGQWFVCGSTLGRIRKLFAPKDGEVGRVAWLSEAPAGVPASLMVAWQDGELPGRFEVGDELRVMPEAEAWDLATYRQESEFFRSLWQPLATHVAERQAELATVPPLFGGGEGAQEVQVEAVAEAEAEAGEADAEGPMAGAVVKVRHAGELTAVLDFITPRVPAHRVQLLKWGVGNVNQLDLTVALSAVKQGLPTHGYAFNLPPLKDDVRREAGRIGIRVRRFELLHELLADLLERAGLPGPQKELDRMQDDAPEEPGYSSALRTARTPQENVGASRDHRKR